MKKQYQSPFLEVSIMDEVDTLTYSTGVLAENEFENADQWFAD